MVKSGAPPCCVSIPTERFDESDAATPIQSLQEDYPTWVTPTLQKPRVLSFCIQQPRYDVWFMEEIETWKNRLHSTLLWDSKFVDNFPEGDQQSFMRRKWKSLEKSFHKGWPRGWRPKALHRIFGQSNMSEMTIQTLESPKLIVITGIAKTESKNLHKIDQKHCQEFPENSLKPLRPQNPDTYKTLITKYQWYQPNRAAGNGL